MHLDLVKLKLAHSPVPRTVYLCPKVTYHFSILEESGVDQQVKRFSAGFKMCKRAAVMSPIFKSQFFQTYQGPRRQNISWNHFFVASAQFLDCYSTSFLVKQPGEPCPAAFCFRLCVGSGISLSRDSHSLSRLGSSLILYDSNHGLKTACERGQLSLLQNTLSASL